MPKAFLQKGKREIFRGLSLVQKLEIEGLVVLIILFCGSIFYHFVEHWRYLDALYFSSTTLTSVGYGDFTPQTDIGKIFTIFYQFMGIPFFLYATGLILAENKR